MANWKSPSYRKGRDVPNKIIKVQDPSNWLYRAYFKFEEKFIYPIELPTFRKELKVDSSELKKGLDRISAFAVSRYLIQDLMSLKPRNILKNLVTLPRTIFTVISQARSKY